MKNRRNQANESEDEKEEDFVKGSE